MSQAVTKVKAVPVVRRQIRQGDSLPESFARDSTDNRGIGAERESRGGCSNVTLQHARVGAFHVVIRLLAKEPGASGIDSGILILWTRVTPVSTKCFGFLT